jgi:pyruvate-ferredoxin/flavodoxin oxidoreductase
MRPVYHAKSDRFVAKAGELEKSGVAKLAALNQSDSATYTLLRQAIAHLVLGLGGEQVEDTKSRIAAYEAANGPITDAQLVEAIAAVLLTEAFNHKSLQPVDGRLANGMSVMAMAAHTGCNTVYGSTAPNNPHPYPWMNSLFQDGATISWLLSESVVLNHARRSVVPERLADALLDRQEAVMTDADYFTLARLEDSLMTDQEIRELPKVWVVGGDGALGDIGFQNVSKVILQNRPNVKMLMLDTQVYSNTGGQNSDSSTMLGGYDMNQFGIQSQGKLIEKKNVSEAFTSGHGSPFVAQVSMANAAKLYKAMLDGLEYRGTAFFQAYTTCQPEHGVSDNMSADQAKLVRDSRGMPEFVFNPRNGETSQEAFDLKGNPSVNRDWWRTKFKATGEEYNYNVAHWAITEGRFRKHVKSIKEEDAAKLIPLDDESGPAGAAKAFNTAIRQHKADVIITMVPDTPDVNDVLRRLATEKTKDVVLVPLGFISDHMEVLFDLDTEAKQTAGELGMNMVRAGTVGTHPRFVRMIRELLLERIDGSSNRPTLGKLGPRPDVCATDCCLSGRDSKAEGGIRKAEHGMQ